MSIIISNNGEKAVRVDKTSMGSEDRLQQYIYENPESIPLYEIKEDIQLLILAREFSTNCGSIDALGIDAYGEIYIVETKLFNNADKRRVVAQALDYGAALWKHVNDFNSFISSLEQHTQQMVGAGVRERICAHFELREDEVETLFEKMQRNLDDGVFHFVVLMDQLDDRLKDLIIYVNQNSQFDIYAVELEYYRHETQEIIIPRLFGAEVKKDIRVGTQTDGWKLIASGLKEFGATLPSIEKAYWGNNHVRFIVGDSTFWFTCYSINFNNLDKREYGIFVGSPGKGEAQERVARLRSLITENATAIANVLPEVTLVSSKDNVSLAAWQRPSSDFASEAEAIEWLKQTLEKFVEVFVPLMKQVKG